MRWDVDFVFPFLLGVVFLAGAVMLVLISFHIGEWRIAVILVPTWTGTAMYFFYRAIKEISDG